MKTKILSFIPLSITFASLVGCNSLDGFIERNVDFYELNAKK